MVVKVESHQVVLAVDEAVASTSLSLLNLPSPAAPLLISTGPEPQRVTPVRFHLQ